MPAPGPEGGERRRSSIEALQERVDSVRDVVGRNHEDIRALLRDGFSEVKGGLSELSERVGAVEQEQGKQSVRLTALESFRVQQEELAQQRAMTVAAAAERAEKAERRADTLDLLGKVLVGALGGIGTTIGILLAVGVIG